MTAEMILDTALVHFARDGYEGASLREIAEAVGIKKPSIYAHFNSKETLFLRVVEHAFEHERRAALAYFDSNSGGSVADRLRGYLEMVKTDYEYNSLAKFVWRMSYFPPRALQQEVMAIVYPFLDSFEQILVSYLNRSIRCGRLPASDAEAAAVAYMTLIDGICVELLYEDADRFQRKLAAAWPLFWKAISS